MRFELGDSDHPRGHALLYFRDPSDAGRILATYLIVPPIVMDVAKYVPPMLAAQLPLGGLSSMPNVYPLPPFPEPVEGGYEWVRATAEARGDDLLDGGLLSQGDLSRLMLAVSEAAEQYARLYADARERLAAHASAAPAELPSELNVDEILLDVMTASEKVGRLARSLGSLRYAVDGADAALEAETLAELEQVGKRLDASYRAAELIAVARQPGERASALSQLYLERCYRLAAEDYEQVADLDRRIAAAQTAE